MIRRLALAIAVAVAAAVAITGPAAAAGAEAGCSLASTGGTVVRSVDGRTYRLNVPGGLSGSMPLVLSLHGGGQPASLHEAESGWNGYAAANHFIVAYPQATNNLWNFGAGSPDVTWLRHVVADISATYCVDAHRVHAEGYSNGGSMTNRLGCDAADLFASFSSYAGSSATITGTGCTPSRAISSAQMDSVLDPIQPFQLQARFEWVNRNACSAMSFEFSFLAEVWHHRPCAGGTEVLWVDYYAGSHNWPIGPAAADIRNRIWGLFRANPLP